MLKISKNKGPFSVDEIWFADELFDLNADIGVFKVCKTKEDYGKRKPMHTVDINLSNSLDEIWGDMKKSSCRYAINKAEKENVEIAPESSYSKFIDIEKAFREKKKELEPRPEEEYRAFEEKSIVFIGKHEGEPVVGQVYITDGERFRWLWGASKRLSVSDERSTIIGNLNRLVVWRAIQYAKENNCKVFDLGGYNKGDDPSTQGINFFKRSFGGEIVKHYYYLKFYSVIPKTLYNLKHFITGGSIDKS